MMPNNNDDIFSLRALSIDRDQARENLKQDTAATRERLKPSNLMAEAKGKAAQRVRKAGESAVNGVRAHPGITATVAATATLIAMRRPIARMMARQKKTEPDQIEE
tara:strand:- start:458 stop:775 length:318 start_codon:yes stop_codon:yes gene_type:complete